MIFTNGDPDLCRHIASQDRIKLMQKYERHVTRFHVCSITRYTIQKKCNSWRYSSKSKLGIQYDIALITSLLNSVRKLVRWKAIILSLTCNICPKLVFSSCWPWTYDQWPGSYKTLDTINKHYSPHDLPNGAIIQTLVICTSQYNIRQYHIFQLRQAWQW